MPPRPKLVEVIWDDAHADLMEASQSDLEDFHQAAVMHTIGWLLRDDEKGVTVANEECPADQTHRGRTFIPRPLVHSIRTIKGGRSSKAQVKPSSPVSRSDGEGHVLADAGSSQPVVGYRDRE